MSEVGSLVTNNCEVGSIERKKFTLHNTRMDNYFKEADCNLDKKSFILKQGDNSNYFKEADCTLNKSHEDLKSPNSMIFNEEKKSYYSCVIYEDKIKPASKFEDIKYKESTIKANYDAEKIINMDICKKMEYEYKSIIYNAVKVTIFSLLYLLLYAVTNGEYSIYMSTIISVVMAFFSVNLLKTVLRYMIDHNYKLTKKIEKIFKINTLFIQKAESDRKLFILAAQLSKLRIEYSVEGYR